MNIEFWRIVASSWRHIEENSKDSFIPLDILFKTVEKDVQKSNELIKKFNEQSVEELINDDDFWGGL